MNCIELRQGQDASCANLYRRYFQQVVLVNKKDVESYQMLTSSVSIGGDFTCRHRLRFKLLEGKTGFRFSFPEGGYSVFGSFEKSIREGIPQYLHSIQLPITGVDEATKCILLQLDWSEYFGALQFADGTIEIYGFEYGLMPSGYTYDPQNGFGGSVLTLKSDNEALEDEPPFVYESGNAGQEGEDFDNNFGDNPDLPEGDFNDDFNNDFYIGS